MGLAVRLGVLPAQILALPETHFYLLMAYLRMESRDRGEQ